MNMTRKITPAHKQAMCVIRKAGFENVSFVNMACLKVHGPQFTGAVYVNIETDHESKGRLLVDWLCDNAQIYQQVKAALHRVEFSY